MNIIQKPSPNHYQGRGGYRVEYITLHIMAGYLAGTDTLFSRSSSQASSTYGVGGNGDIHQYVSEADGSWADGEYTSNLRSITIEHQGGLDFIPCTQACLDASAALCADIARRYGMGTLVYGVNIKLHRDVYPYTHPACPDKCPNGLNWQYIINKANQINNNGGIADMATPGEIWTYNWKDGKTGKGSLPGGNAYNALGMTASGVTDLKTQVKALDMRLSALSATVTALSKSVGANPTDIADSVDKAVRDRLAKMSINLEVK